MIKAHFTRSLAVIAAASFVGCSTPQPNSSPESGRPPVRADVDLIDALSDSGSDLLAESEYKSDYAPLTTYFVTQDNLAYCGVASGVMVLNALDVERPVSPAHAPDRLFTQANFFNPRAQGIHPADDVAREGMTLSQLAMILKSNGVRAEAVFAEDSSLAAFRDQAKSVLADDTSYLLVNYKRAELGQEYGGHISPIAAYNEEHDRFLILDVSRYK